MEPRRRHLPSGVSCHNRGVAGLGGTSQSPQPHLKDGSVYWQDLPTVMDSNPRCRQLPVTLTPKLLPALLVVPRHRAPADGLAFGVAGRRIRALFHRPAGINFGSPEPLVPGDATAAGLSKVFSA